MNNTVFRKDNDNPIIRPEPGTWKHDRCTSVTLTFKDKMCYFYHDGGIGSWWKGHPGFNWIGLLTCPADQFDGKTFTPFICNPILTHGRFCDIDRIGMISPRVELIDGQFYLYYSAMSYDTFVPGSAPCWKKSIGLAVSPDGINFEKVGRAPIVRTPQGVAAGNPKVFFHDGRWCMLSGQAPADRTAGFAFYLQTSDRPDLFTEPATRIFGPGEPGKWDSKSIMAPAFSWDADDDWYYMLYGGTDRYWDYPYHLGLARSRNLRRWERFPENPIICRGEPGEWDDGAIWVTELTKVGSTYYAWYEGRSAGRNRHEEYSPGATKQIGLLTHDGPLWSL